MSTSEVATKMARLPVVENKNELHFWLREVHVAPDGSKFKVTIRLTILSDQDPQFSFDVRCVGEPAA
ncbi:MAG TPA: hypothetical protein VEB69_10760 [Acidimicrobiia bacterium]|nr:hypothetical protein [Acidimicrobiia bacterium]